MNDNAKKWIETLKSGEYAQTKGCLRNLEGFCCLGVACELHRRETNNLYGDWELIQDETAPIYIYNEESVGLPKEVMSWLGLKTAYGDPTDKKNFEDIDELRSLSSLNDHGLDFKSIAKTLEENEAEYFVGGDTKL